MKLNTIYNECCMETMNRMPDNFLHCVVTSPPYWGLRDYGTSGKAWPAVAYKPMPGMPGVAIPEQEAQLGLEETPEAFVAHIVHIFREVRRVLREDGTLWLNLGDSYAGGGGQFCVPPKNLLGIPWRVAFALQADGWYLRQDIIWAKPNPMPESVTDRCTKAHEYLFLLTRSSRYYYDAEAVKEPAMDWGHRNRKEGSAFVNGTPGRSRQNGGHNCNFKERGRNRRSVWTIATRAYSGPHFAVFPQALVKPCVLAGSPQKVCGKCGAGYSRQVEKKPMVIRKSGQGDAMGEFGRTQSSGTMLEPAQAKTTGWEPVCTCNAGQARSVVYDPFGGSGTTAEVANECGRDWIVSEISSDYVEKCTRPRLEAAKQKTLF